MKTTDRPSLAKKAATEKKPRKAKTAAELKAQVAKARAALAALEQKAYAGEVEEAVSKSSIVADFNAIKAKLNEVKDVVILAVIGKAVGIKRLVVTQAEPKPRAAKKTK